MFRRTDDLGFGTKAGSSRMLNPDGSFNVVRTGMSKLQLTGIYHWLINMPWLHFWLLVLAGYVGINILFAGAYLFIGLDQLEGVSRWDGMGRFCEAFFFSAQTFTTVGYGR